MADADSISSPATTDPRTLHRAVGMYSRDHGWVTHRLMIQQHVDACLHDPAGFGAVVLRHYHDARRRRRGLRVRRMSLIGVTVGLAIGLARWFA